MMRFFALVWTWFTQWIPGDSILDDEVIVVKEPQERKAA